MSQGSGSATPQAPCGENDADDFVELLEESLALNGASVSHFEHVLFLSCSFLKIIIFQMSNPFTSRDQAKFLAEACSLAVFHFSFIQIKHSKL